MVAMVIQLGQARSVLNLWSWRTIDIRASRKENGFQKEIDLKEKKEIQFWLD